MSRVSRVIKKFKRITEKLFRIEELVALEWTPRLAMHRVVSRERAVKGHIDKSSRAFAAKGKVVAFNACECREVFTSTPNNDSTIFSSWRQEKGY